jgi:prolyl-tRNA synthetase
VAPIVLAVVPIFKSLEEEAKVREFIDTKLLAGIVGAAEVAAAGKRLSKDGIASYIYDRLSNQRIIVDWRDSRPGDKQYHWEQHGVPLRIEVGPRDVDGGAFVLKQRLDRSKAVVNVAEASAAWLSARLEETHKAMYEKAKAYRNANIRRAATYDEMKKILAEQGGFVRCYFEPDRAAETKIKEETKATVRCIPFDQTGERGKCIYSGKETATEVLFAQAY